MWSHVCGAWRIWQWIRERNSECASYFVQIVGKVLQKPSKRFNKASGTKAWVVHGCFSGMPGSRPVAHQLTMTNTRETQKLHDSWNCCTNSRARSSGWKSDHSRHCWGVGNWLWDTPTGRIGNAQCRSQICAQDPYSWPETAARQRLYWTSSARIRWWNLLVQGHHLWWALGLRLRPWDKATILPVEKPHFTKAKKGQSGEKQCQQHDHHFL